MQRLAEFIRARAQETYPEPPSEGHDQITKQMVPEVCGRLTAGFSVLDVGCGQGVAFQGFLDAGASKVIGMTTNEEDFKAASAFLCTSAIVDVDMCDMHAIADQYRSGCFDLVWARHVLEHSVAPFFVLHEFHRVLKPGGWLYVEVPGPETACCHESNKNHYSVMGPQMWLNLLTRAGFEVVEGREMSLQTAAGPDKYFGWICKRLANGKP